MIDDKIDIAQCAQYRTKFTLICEGGCWCWSYVYGSKLRKLFTSFSNSKSRFSPCLKCVSCAKIVFLQLCSLVEPFDLFLAVCLYLYWKIIIHICQRTQKVLGNVRPSLRLSLGPINYIFT